MTPDGELERLVLPSHDVGGDEAGLRLAFGVDLHDGATARSLLRRRAALRRTGVVGDARLVVDGRAACSPAERHVVDAVPFLARRVARAVGDADGEASVRVAAEPARVDLAVAVSADALDRGDDRVATPQVVRIDAPDREHRHVVRQALRARPGVGRVEDPAGPEDRDAAFVQTFELLDEERDDAGRSPARVEHVAGEQQRVGVLRQRRVEDPFGRLERRVAKQLAQLLVGLAQPVQRAVETQVAGMHQAKRLRSHRRLLACTVVGGAPARSPGVAYSPKSTQHPRIHQLQLAGEPARRPVGGARADPLASAASPDD